MTIVVSTESIGSLPRPTITDFGNGRITREQGPREQDATGRDSDTRKEARDSPIMSDEEQCASSFATYPLTDKLAGPGLAESIPDDGGYFLKQARACTQLGS